ncbi:MAG: hypothetical protein RRZ70_03035 [Synergistaceae bacterium]
MFICCVVLATLRLYGLNLERKISETSGKIDVYQEQNIVLSNEFSKLSSSARIYTYAKNELGMQTDKASAVIYLNNDNVAFAKNQSQEMPVQEESFIVKINPFVKKAHAKN